MEQERWQITQRQPTRLYTSKKSQRQTVCGESWIVGESQGGALDVIAA